MLGLPEDEVEAIVGLAEPNGVDAILLSSRFGFVMFRHLCTAVEGL
ncbi:hypothetical protein ACCT15_16285 [Rhizobium ruizarguesonis]